MHALCVARRTWMKAHCASMWALTQRQRPWAPRCECGPALSATASSPMKQDCYTTWSTCAWTQSTSLRPSTCWAVLPPSAERSTVGPRRVPPMTCCLLSSHSRRQRHWLRSCSHHPPHWLRCRPATWHTPETRTSEVQAAKMLPSSPTSGHKSQRQTREKSTSPNDLRWVQQLLAASDGLHDLVKCGLPLLMGDMYNITVQWARVYDGNLRHVSLAAWRNARFSFLPCVVAVYLLCLFSFAVTLLLHIKGCITCYAAILPCHYLKCCICMSVMRPLTIDVMWDGIFEV